MTQDEYKQWAKEINDPQIERVRQNLSDRNEIQRTLEYYEFLFDQKYGSPEKRKAKQTARKCRRKGWHICPNPHDHDPEDQQKP